MSRNLALCPVGLFLLSLLGAIPAFASRPYPVDERAVSKLRGGGLKLIIDQMPMFDGNPATLVLERFEVWAPDAQIIKYDKDRKETLVRRPATKFFRGRIAGDMESLVFVSVEASGEISGMAFSGDRKRKLSIRRGIRMGAIPEPRRARRDDDAAPVLVREFDEVDDVTSFPEGGFHCDVESQSMNIMQSLAGLKPKPDSSTAPTVTVGYGLNLAIETDGELYNAPTFGTDATVTAYIGNLIGAASVIYQRDLKTTLTIGTLHLWPNAATDPWTVTTASTTLAAISELGNYWHNNYLAVPRSSVVFVSGKTFSSGRGWSGANELCLNDFYCGAMGEFCGGPSLAGVWVGGYAFCGSSSTVSTTVPDPTLTIGGVQYGMPNTNDFWMLLEVCHELGHNAQGPHTHCVALSPAQQTQYGVPGRTFVDLCYNADGGTCFAGTLATPAEFGTIMSYCHNRPLVGGNIPSRYLFGKAGEPSELMLPLFTASLEAATPTVAITVGSGLACAPGATASITNVAGNTYAWGITGGTITSATNTNAITFTPSAPTVVLTVTDSNAKGCSITSQRTTTSACAALAAPTGVEAHATGPNTVRISWSAVATATSYEVARLDQIGHTYTTAGTTASLFFDDGGLPGNTAYLYKVRAVAPSIGPYSTPDLATVIVYANPILTAGSSVVSAQDLIDMRSAAQAVRTLANQGVFSFTDPTITAGVTAISAVHQSELRTVVNSALSTLSLTAIGYTNPTPTIGAVISAADMNDLRNGIR
jgi:hypothetical protein